MHLLVAVVALVIAGVLFWLGIRQLGAPADSQATIVLRALLFGAGTMLTVAAVSVLLLGRRRRQ